MNCAFIESGKKMFNNLKNLKNGLMEEKKRIKFIIGFKLSAELQIA